MGDGRFAGVDWASEEHAVCVVDEQGRILDGRRYRHSEPLRAAAAFCRRDRAAAGGVARASALGRRPTGGRVDRCPHGRAGTRR
jgi:hypothetical protein